MATWLNKETQIAINTMIDWQVTTYARFLAVYKDPDMALKHTEIHMNMLAKIIKFKEDE